MSISFAKKALASLLLVGVGALAIASMGGGGNKSKDKAVKPEFTPIRTTNGFTLKTGTVYRGSMLFNQQKTNNLLSLNSIATYQKGNTIYILPCKYKLQASPATEPGSSLQMFNLRIKIHK
ncbi:MAG: hypothetical protein ABJB86_01505 [Bacteroidota bacterium]